MASSQGIKRVVQQVRPILSVDREESRRRVLSLYKAWYRSCPFIGKFKQIKIIKLFDIEDC
jgi:NADH dehydrogenase (ubiquinone) 1 alpha subcomplex subunit 6